MVGNQLGDSLVGPSNGPEESRAVERVKTCVGEVRRLADVVQHRRRLRQFCVLAKDERDGARPLGNPETVFKAVGDHPDH